MIGLTRWLSLRPGVQEAKAQLEKSKAEQEESRLLVDEVASLHEENHITARIHAALRGGRA